ncbi:hypothetical protein [Chondromyces apiculatus]|uniref:Uncharacterized protein n=1 Tax=Chondromyces apiculatus DSM 436 TaxID=1192034 RepID=A0A017TH86_9BACT|nr:hypothetical protein [Chondromyces apiculatus]EYF08628.1 Hypothetical protein CAP_4158 [Chondromyces apiculatus DSM 436]
MDISLGSLIQLHVFPTGRRLWAMQQVERRAAERGFPELSAHAARAAEHDRVTRQLDERWAARQLAHADDPVQRIDAVIDRTLVALRDGAESQAAVARPGDGTVEKVGELLGALFPMGVAAVTSLNYADELTAVERLAGRLRGDLAHLIADLGLGRHADRIVELSTEYRAAFDGPRPEPLDFGLVRAARARGQEMLLQAVAMTLGRYPGSGPADLEGRAALLGPILQQQETIRQYFRNRSMVEDVDPETGDIDADAPPSMPATALMAMRS